jgi:hypothetical protein
MPPAVRVIPAFFEDSTPSAPTSLLTPQTDLGSDYPAVVLTADEDLSVTAKESCSGPIRTARTRSGNMNPCYPLMDDPAASGQERHATPLVVMIPQRILSDGKIPKPAGYAGRPQSGGYSLRDELRLSVNEYRKWKVAASNDEPKQI